MLPAILASSAISGVSSLLQGRAASKAAKAQAAAAAQFQARMDAASGKINSAAQSYIKEINQINIDFDPYNVERGFNSFYEQIIVPIERDYAEYVDPTLKAAYSGGTYGDMGMQSGAYKEAVAKSARAKEDTKAQARSTYRENELSRNIALDERQRNIARDKLSAATLAPQAELQVAQSQYSSNKDTIAAQFAASSQKANLLSDMLSGATSGIKIGQALS